MSTQGESRPHTYPFVYLGYVVQVNDPRGKHRVRVRVPKLIEPASAWAYPLTMGGGSPQRGGHVVPALGAKVVVFPILGDIEFLMYSGAMWSEPSDGSEAPSSVADAGTDAHLIQALQVGRSLITIDERDATRSAAIVDTLTGDGITIDMVKNGVNIRGSYAINIQSSGAVRIDAPIVTINGRQVRTGAGMI